MNTLGATERLWRTLIGIVLSVLFFWGLAGGPLSGAVWLAVLGVFGASFTIQGAMAIPG